MIAAWLSGAAFVLSLWLATIGELALVFATLVMFTVNTAIVFYRWMERTRP